MLLVAMAVSVSRSLFARRGAVALAVILVLLGTTVYEPAAIAQTRESAVPFPKGCRVRITPVFGARSLPTVRDAILRRKLRILAIGSSSTAGIGASVAAARYPARLQARLRAAFPGTEVVVVNRGIPGETALGAAARMKREVTNAKPDLVIWQLGTNAAVRHVEVKVMIRAVRRAVHWLRSQNIGLMFIDPQFVDRFKDDAHYKEMVQALLEFARAERIVLIRRYASMADLAARVGLEDYLAKDQFHLNDLGYRCMASYAAHAIVNASGPAANATADGN
jgi:acyl-CoA thioesterase I